LSKVQNLIQANDIDSTSIQTNSINTDNVQTNSIKPLDNILLGSINPGDNTEPKNTATSLTSLSPPQVV